MKARFRPIKVSDFYQIDVQERHENFGVLARANPLRLHQLADEAFSFTMLTGATVQAICGVTPDRTAWALLSKTVRPYTLPLVRYIRAMRDVYVLSGPAFLEIDRTRPDTVRWAKALGAHRVSVNPRNERDRWIYEATV